MRGGPIEAIRPGDRVLFEPGEEHWHGAAATRFMTHLALLEVDDEGKAATWGVTTSATRSTRLLRRSTESALVRRGDERSYVHAPATRPVSRLTSRAYPRTVLLEFIDSLRSRVKQPTS